MTGTLRYRPDDSRWIAQAFVGTDDGGKRRFKTRSMVGPDNRTGRREAELMLAELVVEVDRTAAEILHPAPVDETATVDELCELWFESKRPTWSPTTATTNRVNIDRYISPHLGGLRIDQVRGHHLDRLYATLAESGGRAGRGLSPSTIKRVHTVLSGVFRQAVRWRLIVRSPIDEATAPKVRRAEIHPPEPTELAAAVTAAADSDPMLHVFVVLAANTGCRRGELVGVQWRDIDTERDTLTIRRSVVADGGRSVAKGTKTDRARTVALTGTVMALLDQWRREQQRRALAQGVGRLKPTGWVFAHDLVTVDPPRHDWPTAAWGRLRSGLGLERVRLHDLRHFAATQLLGAGVDIGTVADRLGHARPSTTTDVYRHHLPERDREAAQLLGDIIDGSIA